MSLRSLPLRFKLVIALVLPMLIVTVLLGNRVNDSFSDRRVAALQLDEGERLQVVSRYSDAVGAESVITNDPTATPEQLAAARATADARANEVAAPDYGIDPDVVRRIGLLHAELVQIREFIGDSPGDISAQFQLEAYVAPNDDEADPASMAETVPSSLNRLYELPTAIAMEFAFDEDAVVDVETSQMLADYELVQRLRTDHVQELSVLLQLAATPTELVDEAVLEDFAERVGETDVSRSLLFDFADPSLVADVSSSRRSVAGAEYTRLRAAAQRTGASAGGVDDVAAVNRAGALVAAQYAEMSDDVVSGIRSQAEDTAGAARTSLVLAFLAGAWILVIAGLILRMLYRAIRGPLQRLTEQSQHIARVELPYVVTAMRSGDLEQAPETTDLVADANDEIGDLVVAFNDMHRTAIELAAEQAGSRRIVADMFVNLGRRNQRLVNRLLKRLTNLERDEQDPDKLAGLYEIDHVVTRMRRNAESLLVLAGASQARRSDRPLEIYDVARGALSEVEGYERVDITAVDDFEIHGDVVADLTHLLAELVENALSFSPPDSRVEISPRRIGDEHIVSITDIGIGMTDTQIAAANDRIRRAGTEGETPSEFLGHYVIGRLAARHGIDVHLAEGVDGRGIVAEVLVPLAAVVPSASDIVDTFVDDPRDETVPTVRSAPVESTVDAASASMPSPHESVESPPLVQPVPVAAAMPATFGQQTRRVPAATPAATPAPGMEPSPAPAPTIAPAPLAVPAPVATPTPAPAPAATPTLPSDQTIAPIQWTSPRSGSSFDYPPSDQIDPRLREAARPRPAPATPTEPIATPTLPTDRTPHPTGDLAMARNSANDAVEGALSAFGSARRTPGASLPETSFADAFAGRLTLDLGSSTPSGGATPHDTAPPAPVVDPTPDPNEIRFQLSGFQLGTIRADEEN